MDSGGYQIYRANMQSLFSEMVQNADMVIFNRCKSSDPLTNYRRGIKVVNPSCDISFEDEDGELIDLFEENTPYDMDAPIIEMKMWITVSSMWIWMTIRTNTLGKR